MVTKSQSRYSVFKVLSSDAAPSSWQTNCLLPSLLSVFSPNVRNDQNNGLVLGSGACEVSRTRTRLASLLVHMVLWYLQEWNRVWGNFLKWYVLGLFFLFKNPLFSLFLSFSCFFYLLNGIFSFSCFCLSSSPHAPSSSSFFIFSFPFYSFFLFFFCGLFFFNYLFFFLFIFSFTLFSSVLDFSSSSSYLSFCFSPTLFLFMFRLLLHLHFLLVFFLFSTRIISFPHCFCSNIRATCISANIKIHKNKCSCFKKWQG